MDRRAAPPPLTPANSPCCVGQWQGPYDLGFSCTHVVPGGCYGCGTDEIVHAALIPTGAWQELTPDGDPVTQQLAGKVLLWTFCASHPGYTSHIWNPLEPDAPPELHPELLEKINPNGVLVDHNSAFCSGHAWVLDGNKDPKLLVVGGVDGSPFEPNSPCINSGFFQCGLRKVFWFNPLSASPDTAWSDTPEDLSDDRYYPSVTTYLTADDSEFLPMVLGGGSRTGDGCDGGSIPYQRSNWWTLDRPLGTSSWTNHTGATYLWHFFPRTFLLTSGDILTAGSAITCERPVTSSAHIYGGQPVRLVKATQTPQILDENPSLDPNPPTGSPTVGGWYYANGAILHTLRDFVFDEANPVPHYDLDRVLMSGGSQQRIDNSFNGVPPQGLTLEWLNGTWVTKAPPFTPRVYGSWVILPDRTLLAIGGANNSVVSTLGTQFFGDAELFDPGLPLGSGAWSGMAPRLNDPTAMIPIQRAYHSLAMLLPDGGVVMMGGRPPSSLTDSNDTVEVYKPRYFFEPNRPKITSVSIPDIHYGASFCISVDKPNKVHHACLIGISSVTHHFDYGQRYVEMPTTTTLTGCSGGNIKILAPPLKRMAPEGYYLLFVVEQRGATRVPSKGVFVKLY